MVRTAGRGPRVEYPYRCLVPTARRSRPARCSGVARCPGRIVTFAVSSVTAPPSGMASRALTTRLRTIWKICPASALTDHNSSAGRVSSTMLSRISRCRPVRARSMTSFEVEDGLLQPLFAAEHDELTRQVGRQFRRVTNRLHLGRARIAGRQVIRQYLDVADDGRQHVVEIVSDPAGEPPDGFDVLGVAKLRFEGELERHVAHDFEPASDGRRTSAASRRLRRQSDRRFSSDAGTRREGWRRPAGVADRRCPPEGRGSSAAGIRRAYSRRRQGRRG